MPRGTPFNEYVGGRLSRETQIRLGRIYSKNADGSYYVTDVKSQGRIRATTLQANESYTTGQYVTYEHPVGGGRTKGVGAIILGRSSLEMQNAADQPPTSDTGGYSGITISSISPTTFTPGDTNVTVNIYGTGFTSAPSYTNAWFTDASAATVTSTHITLHVSVAWVALPSTCGLVFGAQTFADVFTVGSRSRYLWVGDASAAQKVYRMSAGSLALLSSISTSVGAFSPLSSSAIASYNTQYLWIHDGVTDVGRLDKGTLTLAGQQDVEGGGTAPTSKRGLVTDGTYLYFPYTVGTIGATVTLRKKGFSGGAWNYVASVILTILDGDVRKPYYDGTYIWMPEYELASRIVPATMARTTFATRAGTTGHKFTDDGTSLYMSCDAATPTGAVVKVSRVTPSVTATCTGLDHPLGLCYLGGYVYVVTDTNSNPGYLRKIDVSTMTVTASVAIGAQPRDVTTDGQYLYVTHYNSASAAGKSTVAQYDTSLSLIGSVAFGDSIRLNEILYTA